MRFTGTAVSGTVDRLADPRQALQSPRHQNPLL